MNNLSITLLLIFLFIDLLVNAARTGLLNVRLARLLYLKEGGENQVDRTIQLVQKHDRLRASMKLAQGLLRVLIVGMVVNFFITPQSLTVSIYGLLGRLALAALIVWLAEILVERRVLNEPESWAIRLTPIANLLTMLFSPLVGLTLWLFKHERAGEEKLVSITEDELKSLVDASQRQGVLEQEEGKMIYSIIQLGDTLVREIMIPRIDMFTIDVNSPISAVLNDILESGYSRVPVYEDSVDNIVGLLYTKDVLKLWQEGQVDSTPYGLLRPANFIPEAKKADELLAEMQAQRTHIAIVVDEYGGVAGLVTLEDIVEEIFGEIRDEYDQGEEVLFTKVDEREYIFHGRIDLDDFNDIMDSQLPTEEADTLGGLIYSRIGRIPRVGEQVREDDLLLTVEKISGRRIHKVRAQYENALQAAQTLEEGTPDVD
ncbi:MAG: DUF21 domain-containing protein [Anaerolineales bacterium]|nr:DUF21 domain-containing protein [Anaerolineales bacterium]